MLAKTLMVQGTASSVGKSILVTALCRIFKQDGYRVAPFKAQNMALNSYVTREGGEIGRAQAVQAEAAGIEPTVDMNPVLLKPEADSRSQVIVLGKVAKNLRASEYYDYTPYLLQTIEGSLNRLRAAYDIVVIEGAGSPAEINLKEREIVNMRIARLAGAPVLLVGDIDRGGVFASLVGTLVLLTEDERNLVKGLIINKFRGDLELLKPGLVMLENRALKPVLGVVPFFRGISIAQEDSVFLEDKAPVAPGQGLNIAVIRLPHISNYDDFDPLEEMGCTVRYIYEAAELGSPDLIILPGTKSTIPDLVYLKQKGLDQAIVLLSGARTPVVGICGGYQMLGRVINDPLGIESDRVAVEGLRLLDCETHFQAEKRTVQVKAGIVCNEGLFKGLEGTKVNGYEIHMGQTSGKEKPAFQVLNTPGGKADYFDGAVGGEGLILGSYLHGLFHNELFSRGFLDNLREFRGLSAPISAPKNRNSQYTQLADIVRRSLDIKQIYQILNQSSVGEKMNIMIK
jgi:adenosylcobyric acid synthase